MSKLPSLTGKEVIKALGKADFEVARVRGIISLYTVTDG
ncbi:MAG: type II toxin-antitoxin system HicA family toxin [Dolichospermum sp.]